MTKLIRIKHVATTAFLVFLMAAIVYPSCRDWPVSERASENVLTIGKPPAFAPVQLQGGPHEIPT